LFDDPFDVLRELGADVSAADILRAGLPDFVERLGAQIGFKFTPKSRTAILKEFRAQNLDTLASLSPYDGSISAVKAFWRDLIGKLRILCVSERSDIASMWSRRAEGHRGIVFRFECSDFHDSPLLVARRVTYSRKLPALETPEGWSKACREAFFRGRTDLLKEYCYLKTPDWKTEREWRVVSFAREGETGFYSDWRFAASTLSEVIFGYQMDHHDRADILKMLSHAFGHVRAFDVVVGTGNKFHFREVSRVG
jgi:hypothetical protein